MAFQMLHHHRKDSRFGLVIDWRFHQKRRWVSALTGYLVDAIVTAFQPVIITSQFDYWRHKRHLDYIVSMEPGWAAPRIRYDTTPSALKAVFYSDPHYRPDERRQYFDRNGFDYVFSYYRSPFFRHFQDFPESKFVHMPWAIPDRFVGRSAIIPRSNEVAIFGGKQGDSYDVRNWCREQPGVTSYDYSGVENKRLSDEEYFRWLAGLDAAIAAGSSLEKYDLVTPKYFEIAAAGALLIGQSCRDLESLGFNDHNMLAFTVENFADRLAHYRANYEEYAARRAAGRELIRARHLVSHRISRIREVLQCGATSD